MAKKTHDEPRKIAGDYAGGIVKHYRLKKAWTQKQLAEKIGSSLSFISHIENGASLPANETVEKLVDALGISEGDAVMLTLHRLCMKFADLNALDRKTIEDILYVLLERRTCGLERKLAYLNSRYGKPLKDQKT